MPKFKPVTHVIFDLDGLLLDTEKEYTNAYTNVLTEYGCEYKYELKQQLLGRSQPAACNITVDYYKLPISPEELGRRLSVQYKLLFPNVDFMPGAERLVRHFAARKVPISVCTGSSKQDVDLKTAHVQEAFKLFHDIVACPDEPKIQHGKPHPDAFLHTASLFPGNVDPQKILVFEDAANGVQAALAAGMQVVFVPDDRFDGPEKQSATLTLKSLVEFKPELFGLPGFM